jgi:outer membrane protein assembly factor BamB
MNKSFLLKLALFTISSVLAGVAYFIIASESISQINSSDTSEEKNTDSLYFNPLPPAQTFLPETNISQGFSYEVFDADTVSAAFTFENFSNKNASNDSLSIFNFRGSPQRNNPSRGTIPKEPIAINLEWEFKTGYDTTRTKFGLWGGGAGWTGQPLVIKWTKEQKKLLLIKDKEFIEDDNALEIIIGSLSGDIYFLNSKTGKPTRPHLSIGNPIKGTISVDPRKNGLLFVGQGIQHTNRFGAYVFDMFNGTEVLHINGVDQQSRRRWGAFDSNPLIDEKSGTIFWPAENGLIYKFSIDANKTVGRLSKMRYQHPKLSRAGIESSMAVIDKYGFVADNSGTVMCIDLKTMAPIWNVSNLDDSDATIAVDTEPSGKHYLYTGSEVDFNGPIGTAFFRKLNPINGEEIWKVSRECRSTPIQEKTNSGGILSSPVIGKMKGSNLVYCLFSRVDDQNRGEFVAINKTTGKEAFSLILNHYSWSSPADIYDEEGNIYIFLTDVFGTIYLLDGITGKVLVKERTKFLFESSPVVVNDRIFIASRGNTILSFKIKN